MERGSTCRLTLFNAVALFWFVSRAIRCRSGPTVTVAWAEIRHWCPGYDGSRSFPRGEVQRILSRHITTRCQHRLCRSTLSQCVYESCTLPGGCCFLCRSVDSVWLRKWHIGRLVLRGHISRLELQLTINKYIIVSALHFFHEVRVRLASTRVRRLVFHHLPSLITFQCRLQPHF